MGCDCDGCSYVINSVACVHDTSKGYSFANDAYSMLSSRLYYQCFNFQACLSNMNTLEQSVLYTLKAIRSGYLISHQTQSRSSTSRIT